MSSSDCVRCIATGVPHGFPRYGQTWCGKSNAYRFERAPLSTAVSEPEAGAVIVSKDDNVTLYEVERYRADAWYYRDANHALLNADMAGSGIEFPICAGCAAEIQKTINEGKDASRTRLGETTVGMRIVAARLSPELARDFLSSAHESGILDESCTDEEFASLLEGVRRYQDVVTKITQRRS